MKQSSVKSDFTQSVFQPNISSFVNLANYIQSLSEITIEQFKTETMAESADIDFGTKTRQKIRSGRGLPKTDRMP